MASASPYYLGDARPPPGPAGSGSSAPSAAPAPTSAAASSTPRPYSYDDGDDDYDDEGYGGRGALGGIGGAGSAAAQLQSYQSGSHRPAGFSSSSPSSSHPPASRHLGPQTGFGGGIRLPPGPSGNPVLFDSSNSSSNNHSPLLGGGGASGGIQIGQSVLGGSGASTGGPRFRTQNMGDAHASYSTSFSWSLSSACAVAYAFPPLTSVAVLVLETTNDLARFHAYQAGLLGVGGWVLLWVLRSVLGWYSLSVIIGMGLLGWFWVCASNAANAAPTLARVPYLPHVGPLAEQWVGEE
ncbi:hypothetical protein OC844_001562 [Tilletia horrida]|nr:hypothetical protein OC844_001562 [Tilletia horrida]